MSSTRTGGRIAEQASTVDEDASGSSFLEDVLPRRGTRAVLLGTLFLLGAAAFGIVTSVRSGDTIEQLDRAYLLRDLSGRVQMLAADLELVAGTGTELPGRDERIARIGKETDEILRESVPLALRGDQRDRLVAMRALFAERVAEVVPGEPAGASPAGARLDALIREFRDANAAIIEHRRRIFSRSIWRQLAATLAAATGMLTLSALFIRKTRLHLDELAWGRRRLREMNASLEAEVAVRTRELSRINQLFATSLAGSRITAFSQNRDLVYSWIHNPRLGLTTEAVIGRSDYEILPEQGRDRIIAAKLQAMAEARSVTLDVEAEEDGAPVCFRMHVDPLFEGDRIAGVVCAAVDVTEDRRARARLADLTDALSAALQRFDVALREADIIVSAQDLDRRFTFVSRNTLGFAATDLIGRRDEDVGPPEIQERLIAIKDEVLRTGTPRTAEFRIMTEARGERVMKVRFEPQRDRDGNVTGLLGCAVDVTAEVRGQERLKALSDELRTTLRLFDTALRGADVIVFTQDRNLVYSWVSAPVAGRRPEEIVGRGDHDLVGPEVAVRLEEFKRAVLAENRADQAEFRFVDQDGVDRWYAVRAEPDADGDGVVNGLIGALVDVTERRQRETHIRVLMRELAHRTKNLLAVIQAMARQTLTASATARDFEARFSGRLQGLARSLDLLVQENWQGAGIAELVRSQLNHYEEFFGTRIVLSGPDTVLKPEAAQNLGLALHELSTNSSKYGALSTPEGRVSITWDLGRDEAGIERFRFRWQERGGPPVAPAKRKGFGHAVIEKLVPRALSAEGRLRFEPEGVLWEITAPASAVLPTAGALEERAA